MAYTKRTTIEAATDDSMAMHLRLPGSETQDAAIELIAPVAGEVINNLDPEIFEGPAGVAVDAKLAAEDIIVGSDPRSMKLGDLKTWRSKDSAGRVIAEADAQTGVFTAPDFVARRARIAGGVIVEADEGIERWLDSAGKLIFEINARTGRVFVADLDPASNAGGGGGSTSSAIARVVVLWVAGQSNAAGRGLPVGPRLDPSHPRILMAEWQDTVVTGLGLASVPNSSQAVVDTAGYGPADEIARRIVAADESTVVVICNTAKGGAGLVYDTPNGVWDANYAGTNRWLLPIAEDAITATLSWIRSRYPGVPIDVQGVWHQGESDGTISYAAYSAALIELFDSFRLHVGDPTMPIVMGGTVPESSGTTEEANIMGAQIQAQADMEYVAFAAGVHNGGGSSAATGDTVHYNRGGVERLGTNMYQALRRAYANNVASIPLTPLDVFARWRKAAGVLDISWSFPFCRVTAFTVEYRVDGGAWVPITGRPRELDPVATVTGLTTGTEIEVRVSTTNEVGTSAYTVPVIAIGA